MSWRVANKSLGDPAGGRRPFFAGRIHTRIAGSALGKSGKEGTKKGRQSSGLAGVGGIYGVENSPMTFGAHVVLFFNPCPGQNQPTLWSLGADEGGWISKKRRRDGKNTCGQLDFILDAVSPRKNTDLNTISDVGGSTHP